MNITVIKINTVESIHLREPQNKGITLIALIITIIVMLILVGVTINVALNGGLFGKAKKASYQTEASTIKEQLEIAKAIKIADNGGRIPADYGITINNLDIPEKLKTEYGSKLIIDNGILFYNSEIVTDTKEQGWLEEIGIKPKSGLQETEHNWVRTGENIKCNNCERSFTIGDKINYVPTENNQQITSLKATNGEADTVFTQEKLEWVVLGIKDSKTLLITSRKPTTQTITFAGGESYINGEQELNRICESLYSNDKYKARSINLGDINNCLQKEEVTTVSYTDLSGTEQSIPVNTALSDLDIWEGINENYYTPDGENTVAKLGTYKLNSDYDNDVLNYEENMSNKVISGIYESTDSPITYFVASKRVSLNTVRRWLCGSFWIDESFGNACFIDDYVE